MMTRLGTMTTGVCGALGLAQLCGALAMVATLHVAYLALGQTLCRDYLHSMRSQPVRRAPLWRRAPSPPIPRPLHGRGRHKEAHDRCSRRRTGLGPCRGAFRTDRAAGALAEFASACSCSNPWRDCPARSCSPARTRGPSVLHMRHMGLFMFLFRGMWPMHVWVACFPEAASRQRAARYWDRALQPDLQTLRQSAAGYRDPALQPDRHSLRFWRLPCFRRLRRFPRLWNHIPRARGFVRRAAIPAYLDGSDRRAAAFSWDAYFVPQRIHGDSCCQKNPEAFIGRKLPVPDRPGRLHKKRPARGRMGLSFSALRGTHAPLWPRIAARAAHHVRHATLAASQPECFQCVPPRFAHHNHFMPGEGSLP